VRSPRVRSPEKCRRKAIPQALNFSGDDVESESQMVGDVLAEDVAGLDLSDDPSDVGPDVSLVGGAQLLAGARERLAGVARSDAIHHSTPRAAIEGSHVIPDRSRIQDARFHARDKEGGRICFPFDVTHGVDTIGAERELEPKLDPRRPGT
jgi:hypothetical protein